LVQKFNLIVLHSCSSKYSWVEGVKVITPITGEKAHK